jgi:hypothetical protein
MPQGSNFTDLNHENSSKGREDMYFSSQHQTERCSDVQDLEVTSTYVVFANIYISMARSSQTYMHLTNRRVGKLGNI